MALIELLVDASGNVVGIRQRDQSTVRQIATTISGANSFGQTKGASLETKRQTYAQLVTNSTRLNEEQRRAIRQRVIGLTVHDAVHLVRVPETQALFLLNPPPLADAPSRPPSIVIVFVDP